MSFGYPPSHWRTDEPQPEFCDLCGTYAGGEHLIISEADGLQGMAICDVTPGCRRFRSGLRRKTVRDAGPPHAGIGSGRIYPAGAPAGAKDP